MKTALNELIEIIKQKRREREISNTLLKFVQFKAEMLLKTEKKQQEDFAIGFAEWFWEHHEAFYSGERDYYLEFNELLEIYKKTL